MTSYNLPGGIPFRHILLTNAETIDEDFTSDVIEVSYHLRGALQVAWENYDGTTGALNVQLSEDKVSWGDWGGPTGARTAITEEEDHQIFEFTNIPARYLRYRFYLGNGTTADLTAKVTLK